MQNRNTSCSNDDLNDTHIKEQVAQQISQIAKEKEILTIRKPIIINFELDEVDGF